MGDPGDLADRIERAGARIEAPLSDHDLERLMIAAGQRGRRRRVRRIGFSLAAVGVAAVALLIVTKKGGHDRATGHAVAERSATAPASPGTIKFSDGSLATAIDPDSVLVIAEDSTRRMSVDLARGGGRFQIVPNRERSFTVRAGPITVMVVGTVFAVQRLPDRVGVKVERGAVRVAWRTGEHLLHAGEDGWFPLDPPAPQATGGSGGTAPSPARPRSARAPASKAADDQVNEQPRQDPVETMLAAADAARAAGHPDEGAAILKRLIDGHGRDPRAPLAQFTLGRVLLMELDRPREAAVVFAELRARAPDGPFAADALARETEAWSRAGRRAEARARALEYLRLYPDGNRAAAVRGFGGIE
jgi:transmembrane sensor